MIKKNKIEEKEFLIVPEFPQNNNGKESDFITRDKALTEILKSLNKSSTETNSLISAEAFQMCFS